MERWQCHRNTARRPLIVTVPVAQQPAGSTNIYKTAHHPPHSTSHLKQHSNVLRPPSCAVPLVFTHQQPNAPQVHPFLQPNPKKKKKKMEPSTTPTLLTLPPELLNLTLSYLHFPDSYHLRATCRLFASLIPGLPPASQPDWQLLLEAEKGQWARKRNRLACVHCARLLPATRFTDKAKSWRNGAWRACDECRACPESRGARVLCLGEWEGERRRKCGRMRGSGVREVVVGGVEKGVCGCCESAFERWGGRDARARSLCVGCSREQDEREHVGMREAEVVWKGVWIGGSGGGQGKVHLERWIDWDGYWQLEEARIEPGNNRWDGCYCDYCFDEPFTGWREVWKGLNIIKRE